jgi:hypothetical protein
MRYRRLASHLLALYLLVCPFSLSLAEDESGATGQEDASAIDDGTQMVGEVASQVGQAITAIGISQQMMQQCQDKGDSNCGQQQQDGAPQDGN